MSQNCAKLTEIDLWIFRLDIHFLRLYMVYNLRKNDNKITIINGFIGFRLNDEL